MVITEPTVLRVQIRIQGSEDILVFLHGRVKGTGITQSHILLPQPNLFQVPWVVVISR